MYLIIKEQQTSKQINKTMSSTALGIDIGTTHTKICLLNSEDGSKTFRQYNHHGYEALAGKQQVPFCHKEQDPEALIQSVDTCLSDVGVHNHCHISKIAVTGQMHGVILWKPKSAKIERRHSSNNLISLMRDTVEKYSNLITWEDQRCNKHFLQTLPESRCHSNVATGYGSASLLWLAVNKKLENYTMCGTIMDFLVWLLTQSDRVQMTVHNAKSWGYFDEKAMIWEKDFSEAVGRSLLPHIIGVKQLVGMATVSCHGITRKTTEVFGGLGDMQCAMFSCCPSPKEAVLNIGTSAQLSIITDDAQIDREEIRRDFPALDVVPFVLGKSIVTAASLNGGNVIYQFATTIQNWMKELSCQTVPDVSQILHKFKELDDNEDSESEIPSLTIIPRLYSERYDPSSTASVNNIRANNLSLPNTVSALYAGLLENLREMFPLELLLEKYGIEGVVGTGGALLRSKLLTKYVSRIFKVPLRTVEHSDAATGAAMFVTNSL